MVHSDDDFFQGLQSDNITDTLDDITDTLFEGVGKVVFVEDSVAGGEEGGEELLGFVEAVYEV